MDFVVIIQVESYTATSVIDQYDERATMRAMNTAQNTKTE